MELRIFHGCFCGQLGQGCLTTSTPRPLFSLSDIPKRVPDMNRMIFIPSVRHGFVLILKLIFFPQICLMKWLQAMSLCHPQNSYLLSNHWWKSLNSVRLITIKIPEEHSKNATSYLVNQLANMSSIRIFKWQGGCESAESESQNHRSVMVGKDL